MHDIGPENSRIPPLLPSSSTVTQKNTLCATAQSIHAGEVWRMLECVQHEMSRLPARAHDAQTLARIRAIRRFSPDLADPMAECGRIKLVSKKGTNAFYPVYCLKRGCKRCAPVQGRVTARRYTRRILEHLTGGNVLFRVTLTQLRVRRESDTAALDRFERALDALHQRLRSKKLVRDLGFVGALVSIENVVSSRKGSHVHAHILWLADHLNVPLLRAIWLECRRTTAPGLIFADDEHALDVQQFDAREHPSVKPAEERLQDFVGYQFMGQFFPADENNDDDLHCWARALVGAAGERARLVRSWGTLHGRNGQKQGDGALVTPPPPSLTVNSQGETDDDDAYAETQELQSPSVPDFLDQLIVELKGALATDKLSRVAIEQAQFLKDILPRLQWHVDSVVAAHSRIPPLAPGRFLQTPIFRESRQQE